MKKILKIFIPLIILSALIYQFRSEFGVRFSTVLDNLKNNVSGLFIKLPCAEPIPYTLGTFDTQFNISKSYFLSALTEAEAIWEKPFGKQLFTYKENDKDSSVLKVNLIYDYRQQATSKLKSLGIIVENNQASYDDLKAKFTILQENYNQQKTDFETRVNAFNQREQAYEAEVQLWNNRGGAGADEYKLEVERQALNAEATELKIIQTNINNMADEINALVVALNRLVDSLNLSVAKYNTTNVSRGESFEEGVYSSNGSKSEIDIYEFSNREKLVRVLAHELGHALGLEHVDDPKAIMYKLNQGSNATLTKADLDALKAKCGVE